MKKIYVSIYLILLSTSVFAQIPYNRSEKPLSGKKAEIKGPEVICPANFEDANTYVPPPQTYLDAQNNKNARSTAAGATIIVTYTGFSPAAQRSFQAAIDIWATLITSPTTIRVDANFLKLDAGVLGSARSNNFRASFPGQIKAQINYPMPLAEKIARQDLNSVNVPDIVAQFNNSINWYYGQSLPGNNQFDFTTIVLHELCHGLGFTTSFYTSGNTGQWGYSNGAPGIYDTFIENGDAKQLINTTNFANPSQQLRQQITSDNIFLNSPTAIANNKGEKPKIFAPQAYQPGSSMAHVNDATYPPGNVNSLMTSAASQRETSRDPGPIVMGLFTDLGWKSTSVLHTALDDYEVAKTLEIKANITSDTTLVPATFKVVYTENSRDLTKAKSIDLTRVGTTNDYTATIPITITGLDSVRYYISAQDIAKRTFTSPPEAPRFINLVLVGVEDKVGPQVIHSEPDIFPSAAKFDILAFSADNFAAGIESVKIDYSINGVDKPSANLKKYNPATDDKKFSQGQFDSFTYILPDIFKDLKNGDRVKYRLTATDNSKNKNKTILPAYYSGVSAANSNTPLTPDFFEFLVADAKATAVKTYSADFNAANPDFSFIGFNIGAATGFDNGALHSPHPYKNGANTDLESSWIAQLMTPIQIKDTASIEFDEVVLVEPGEKGSVFGDQDFYDYVVVEGSPDGVNWIPFEDGYDSGAFTDWSNTFNSRAVNGPEGSQDSRAEGTKALFKKRKINMRANDYYDFEIGDVVLVRFRLLADAFTNGWGWAIDNLKIQVPPPPPITSIVPQEKEEGLSILPNPTPDELEIRTKIQQSGKVFVEVVGMKGERVMMKEYQSNGLYFNEKMNISALPAGSYFVRLYTEKGIIAKRFIVSK